MKNILLVFLLSFPVFFQACTGCNDDETYPSPSKKEGGSVQNTTTYPANEPRVDHTSNGRIVIKMKKENGVYKIPVSLNGTEMDFIFDTGAGIISISDLEASFLYKQGKITKDDIIGKENFQDATGNISEGAIINLKEVSIGGKTIYNIRASVVNNVNAPLLLGQTALEKFGQVTIDYENGQIIFQ
jgi:aspartyl protease family protein